MSFSSFSKNYKSNENVKSESEKKINESTEKEELIDRYNSLKDKSESELMEELFKQVNAQKQNGNFNYDELENSVKSIQSFLSEEQREKINFLLQQIKS